MFESTPRPAGPADIDAEVIDLDPRDAESQSQSVGSKRKAGRKPSDAWKTFKSAKF